MPPSFYHRRPTPSFFLPTPWLLAQPPTHPPTPTLLPPRLCLLCPILSGERGRGMARTALSFAFFSLFLLFSLLSPDRKAGDSTPLPSFFSRETRGGEGGGETVYRVSNRYHRSSPPLSPSHSRIAAPDPLFFIPRLYSENSVSRLKDSGSSFVRVAASYREVIKQIARYGSKEGGIFFSVKREGVGGGGEGGGRATVVTHGPLSFFSQRRRFQRVWNSLF